MALTKTKKSSNFGSVPLVFARRREPVPTRVFDTYWHFAAERQAIYFRRLEQDSGPWTRDPILAQYKFTNAYRAADRVSQYLIRNVIYADESNGRDTVFRVLLFKLFNKIETWELLQSEFGRLQMSSFKVDRFDSILSKALQSGARVYSAAYIMPNAPRTDPAAYKHRTHLDLLDAVIREGLPEKLLAAQSMGKAFEMLLTVPSIGPFLAYQYVVDLAYSEHFTFDEDDFVQPGPGALNGLAKCFSSLGDFSPSEAIEWVTQRQELEFERRGLAFQRLWGRRLHLIDCQNLFCEVDKYARVAHPEFNAAVGRSRIKQKFTASGNAPPPWFPPKWKLAVPPPLHLPRTGEESLFREQGAVSQQNLFTF